MEAYFVDVHIPIVVVEVRAVVRVPIDTLTHQKPDGHAKCNRFYRQLPVGAFAQLKHKWMNLGMGVGVKATLPFPFPIPLPG